jgi:hypothetical protein
MLLVQLGKQGYVFLRKKQTTTYLAMLAFFGSSFNGTFTLTS